MTRLTRRAFFGALASSPAALTRGPGESWASAHVWWNEADVVFVPASDTITLSAPSISVGNRVVVDPCEVSLAAGESIELRWDSDAKSWVA